MRLNKRIVRDILGITAAGLSLGLVAPAVAATPAQFTQSIIDDMQRPNGGVQIGLQRNEYAVTHMGMMARGDYTPKFWVPTGPLAAWLKGPNWWTAITPWWNAIPLQGNAAPNAKIEVGTIATIGRRKGTQTWYTIFSSETGWVSLYDPSGTYMRGAPATTLGTTPNYKSKIYQWTGGTAGDNTLHGGSGVFPVDAQSLDGIINCIASRVVGPDAAKARFGMWAGMDWYPNTSYRYGQNGNGPAWGPAISASRLEKIGTDWTVTCTAPLDNPGRAGTDMHYKNTVGVFMSTSTLKANPVAEIPGLLPAGATTTPPPVVTVPPVVTPPPVVTVPPVVTPPPVVTNPKAAAIKELKQKIKAKKLELLALQTQLWNLM